MKEGWIQRKGSRAGSAPNTSFVGSEGRATGVSSDGGRQRKYSAPNTSFVGHFSMVAALQTSSQHPRGKDDKKYECDDNYVRILGQLQNSFQHTEDEGRFTTTTTILIMAWRGVNDGEAHGSFDGHGGHGGQSKVESV